MPNKDELSKQLEEFDQYVKEQKQREASQKSIKDAAPSDDEEFFDEDFEPAVEPKQASPAVGYSGVNPAGKKTGCGCGCFSFVIFIIMLASSVPVIFNYLVRSGKINYVKTVNIQRSSQIQNAIPANDDAVRQNEIDAVIAVSSNDDEDVMNMLAALNEQKKEIELMLADCRKAEGRHRANLKEEARRKRFHSLEERKKYFDERYKELLINAVKHSEYEFEAVKFYVKYMTLEADHKRVTEEIERLKTDSFAVVSVSSMDMQGAGN